MKTIFTVYSYIKLPKGNCPLCPFSLIKKHKNLDGFRNYQKLKHLNPKDFTDY